MRCRERIGASIAGERIGVSVVWWENWCVVWWENLCTCGSVRGLVLTWWDERIGV